MMPCPFDSFDLSISYRFIADNSRKSRKLAAMMPVAVCDNRIWITFGIFPGGSDRYIINIYGEGIRPRGRQHSWAPRSNKQTKKQTKPKVLAAGKPDSFAELFPPSTQTQLKLFWGKPRPLTRKKGNHHILGKLCSKVRGIRNRSVVLWDKQYRITYSYGSPKKMAVLKL